MAVWLGWMERSWVAGLRGAWCLALGLGLSAFFWLPAVSERQYVHVGRLLEGYFDFHSHFVYLSQIIYSPWGYGGSRSGPDDGMSFGAGYLHLILTGAAALLLPKLWRASRWTAFIVVFALVLVVAAAFMANWSSTFIWDRLPLLQYLEFPWRFLSILAVGTAILSGLPLLLVAGRRSSFWVMVALIVAFLVLNLPHATPRQIAKVHAWPPSPEGIASTLMKHTSTGEYVPIWVIDQPMTPAEEALAFIEGQGRVVEEDLSPAARRFRVQAEADARLRLNTFYFPGWTLYVDGRESEINYDNPQGVMEFSVEPGRHDIVVRFADTPIRTAAKGLSLLAALALASLPWIHSIIGRRRSWRTVRASM
jgi:hypothetical protein